MPPHPAAFYAPPSHQNFSFAPTLLLSPTHLRPPPTHFTPHHLACLISHLFVSSCKVFFSLIAGNLCASSVSITPLTFRVVCLFCVLYWFSFFPSRALFVNFLCRVPPVGGASAGHQAVVPPLAFWSWSWPALLQAIPPTPPSISSLPVLATSLQPPHRARLALSTHSPSFKTKPAPAPPAPFVLRFIFNIQPALRIPNSSALRWQPLPEQPDTRTAVAVLDSFSCVSYSRIILTDAGSEAHCQVHSRNRTTRTTTHTQSTHRPSKTTHQVFFYLLPARPLLTVHLSFLSLKKEGAEELVEAPQTISAALSAGRNKTQS